MPVPKLPYEYAATTSCIYEKKHMPENHKAHCK
jgi:hypothetical protein